MKILVGVDGSSNSFATVAFVGRLVAPERDELTLVFATPTMSFDDERLDAAVQERARSALSRAVLDAALDRLPEPWRGRAMQKEVAGSPGPSLVDAAEESGADLIVVGFHGTSSIIQQFMLGSVSRTVVQSAKVPVLVVKGGTDSYEPASAAAPAGQLRVLVAYDPTHAAESMASVLQKFTWPPETEGRVLTVVRPMYLADLPDWVMNHPRDPDVAAMADEWMKEHEQNLSASRDELEQFRKTLPPCFARGEAIVAEGRPAEQIVDTIRELHIDLAVLGSGRGGRFERFLLGTTSEQVLASATCSVLIAR
ncbi:MAG: universal stress protein [Planctomycetes bacterium]|nr:universal stress protein [Planctomycetota bacterium]